MPEQKEQALPRNEFENAARLAAKAMDQAHRHQSPPRPHAYEVWYTYVAGDDPVLRARVDSELIKSDEVGVEIIEQIYEEHFLHKRLSDGMTRIGDELDAGLRDTISVVRDSLGASQLFLGSLRQAQGKVAKVSRNHDAKQVVADLLELGQAHAASTELVNTELTKARSQVVELQSELRRLRNSAYLDHLTQIPNRRHMDEVLEREIRLASENGLALSFVLGDLDHFKEVNDSYGHAVGDAVLKHFAGLIRNNIKGQDTAARYGGEEFAIILPRTSVYGAGHLTDKIRELFHGTDFILSRDRSSIGRISVSFGVTQLVPGESMEDLVSRADGLLYRAKKLGRNRVESDM
ncbi:MAG: GGDEF domain-containing protein [Proteobacteria bacterium]|nr:GGDEF domain-containing protein [Pseudomonadota bacterium]